MKNICFVCFHIWKLFDKSEETVPSVLVRQNTAAKYNCHGLCKLFQKYLTCIIAFSVNYFPLIKPKIL